MLLDMSNKITYNQTQHLNECAKEDPYQQRDVWDDHSAVLVDRQFRYELQDLVMLESNSSVVMKFDVNLLHVFSGRKR
jgi:hypothetical protein